MNVRLLHTLLNEEPMSIGMKTYTATTLECYHRNGWYINVKFWIFSKRVFVCSDCGHHRNPIKAIDGKFAE